MNEVKDIKCTASDIYYRMLQIGSETTENGISLSELKKQLHIECLVTNPNNTEHIEQWFNWAFEHKSFGCHCPIRQSDNDCGCNNDDPCSQYDHDNNCNRFLNKDSIIEFSLLEQSHKQTEQLQLNRQQVNLLQGQITLAEQNTKEAQKESRFARNLAWGSIAISLLLGIPDLISVTKDNDIDHLPKEIEESITLLPSNLYETNQLLDSLVRQNQRYNKNQETIIENVKILKYINQKLVKINKFNEENKND